MAPHTQRAERTDYFHHPLFEASPSLWPSVADIIRRKHFADRDRVFSHGDDAAGLWLVARGWVKLVRQTPDGKETIVGLCTEGELFGEAALFAGASYPYSAEVVGQGAELAAIPANALRALLAKDASLSASMMSLLSHRTSQAELKLEHLNTMSAAQRLGCFLLRLCHSHANGAKTLHIPVEKNVLAAYLGMKPETLSRSQQQLKPVDIQVNGQEITIGSVEKLRDFVCDSCSESGACDAEPCG